MSDVFTRLREEAEAWPLPEKNLGLVTSRGRKITWARRAGATALCLLVLTGTFIGIRSFGGGEPGIDAASDPFDLVAAAAEMNGVILERADLDSSWEAAPPLAPEWPSLLAEGPIPVLVTSPGLGRGMQGQRAWADIIDGWAPGPLLEESSRVSRVFVTLQLVGGGLVHLPVAPPYERWGDGEKPSFATVEPAPLVTRLEWENVSVNHPINWRRITFGYDPGGSVTDRSGLTITNMATSPEDPPGVAFPNRYDMTDAPSDAVVLRISRTTGGPVTTGCDTEDRDCETDVQRGSETIDYPGNYSGTFYVGDFTIWFWVGKDASETEIAAFEQMRSSIEVSADGSEIDESTADCPSQDGAFADVDGDGVDEFVYHSWVNGAARVGVCFRDGKNDSIAGIGQAESLMVLHEEVVDRDVLLFGATGMRESVHRLAIWKTGRLRLVVSALTNRPLEARAGVDAQSEIAWAWGWNCDRIEAPGAGSEVHGTFVQVRVERSDGRLLWRAHGYNWRNTRVATSDSSRRGSIESGDPLVIANRMIDGCSP